jgi:hypothetical protein
MKPPFELAVVACQPAATQKRPAATIATLPPVETTAGPYRQLKRRLVPTVVSNGGRNNGGSMLFLPMLNPTIYFRKIEEKI